MRRPSEVCLKASPEIDTRGDFIYDAECDHYTCPAGAKLTRVLLFGDRANASFATALGATNIALLRANQQAEFGF
jgi:hypothetical protein